MEIHNNIYFTFFSTGSLIPVIALGYITIFLLAIPKKSYSTTHLAYGYFLMTIFNFAYLISSSVYDTLAAYHRWLTVAVIIPAEIHFNMFLLYYGGFSQRRMARWIMLVQYVISLTITLLFCIATFNAPKIFHFDGHYWDFDADRISARIGIVIILYILFFVAILIYKSTVLKGRERKVALYAGISYLSATLIPAITNTLSRKGVIDREVFQVSWVLFNLFGFFLLAVVYINNTKERTNLLSQITAISLVTILTLFQVFSYLSMRDLDKSFHELRVNQAARSAAEISYRPPGLVYMAAFTPDTLRPLVEKSTGNPAIWAESRTRIPRSRDGESADIHSLAHAPLHRFIECGEHHTITYLFTDEQRKTVYEAGFTYESYRAYLHPTSKKHLIMALFLLGFVLIGFRLFFLGIFVHPFKKLVHAVSLVNEGRLDTSVPSSSGHEIGYLADAFTRMVHSIKKSQDELEETKLYLKNIVDSMPSVLIGVNSEARITHWNIEAQRITSMNEDEVLGKRIDEMVPQMSILIKRIDRTIRRKKPLKFEKVTYQINDETRIGDIMIYPLVANGVRGAVIRVDDITDRVRIEEMMVQSEKMASVGGLAAGMAHEINNPLGGIMMAAQNIIRRLSPDLAKNREIAKEAGTELEAIIRYMNAREINKMVEGILEMGERASKIVTNMLNFSRRSESKMAPANIVDVMEKALDLAANDYNLKKKYDFRHIEITRDYEENIPQISCIVTEIQQVILNLLKNAAQAMAEKHYEDTRPHITIRIRKETFHVRIEIEDNGPGIPEKIRKRIFEPFFTTKSAGIGTGLGLSVSYFIIHNDHKGTLNVESETGKWSKFTIRLPITSAITQSETSMTKEPS